MTQRILCQAIVDEVDSSGKWKLRESDRNWWVTVTGQPPHDEVRHYPIVAPCDNDAAQEGLRRFVEEMEARTEE